MQHRSSKRHAARQGSRLRRNPQRGAVRRTGQGEYEKAHKSLAEVPRRAPDRRGRNKRPRGRPHVLRRRHKDVICALTYAGCSRAEAAEYVGCSPRTIANQLRRDEQFADQMRTALTRRELSPLCRLAREGRRSWRAAIWFLERIHPGRYGRGRPRPARWNQVQAALDKLIKEVRRACGEGEKNGH